MPESKPLTGYPSIDKPWLKYYSKEAINAPLPECSIYEYLWENNKKHLDDVALIYFGRKITYRALFSSTDRAAKSLIAFGTAKPRPRLSDAGRGDAQPLRRRGPAPEAGQRNGKSAVRFRLCL